MSLEQDKQDLKEIMIELEQRRIVNPLPFFIPNGVQDNFNKNIADDYFGNVLNTGNGLGKTIDAINVIGNLIFGPQNKWFDYPFFHNFIRPCRLRIISTARNIAENIVPELINWLPKNSYEAIKGGRTFLSEFTFTQGIAKGSKFDLMTYDTDKEQFAGPTIHCHWFDEPPPYDIYSECVSRMRKGGFMMITMTPLYGGGWIFDKLDNPFEASESWKITHGDIEDNCKKCGVRGVLEHDTIQKIIAEWPLEEREARKTGKPIHLEGIVYPMFNKDAHIISADRVPKDDKGNIVGEIYNVVDPHDRKPFAIGWYYVDPTGDIYTVHEWPNEPFHIMKSCSLELKDYADLIKGIEEQYGWEHDQVTRIIDARYGNRKSVQTGKTIVDDFDDHELYYDNSYTDNGASVAVGHLAVKKYLSYDKTKPVDSINKPKFYIVEDCVNHIYGFLHYKHSENRRPEKRGIQEKVEEAFKDFPDLVRYLIMDEPGNNLEVREENTGMPQSWKKYHQAETITSYEGLGV